MNKLFTFCLLVSSFWANGQPANWNLQTERVREFYKELMKTSTNLTMYYKFFGPFSEDEGVLFGKLCTENCDNKAVERRQSPSNFESLVFNELRKRSHLLVFDNLEASIDKAEILDNLLPDAIDVLLRFDSSKVVIFTINCVENESPYILDIHISNGASIFNGIRVGPAVFYKRLSICRSGATNIRSEKGVRNKSIATLQPGELFFLYPNYSEGWWRVTRLNCDSGFVSRSRVQLIGQSKSSLTKWRNSSVDTLYSRPLMCK